MKHLFVLLLSLISCVHSFGQTVICFEIDKDTLTLKKGNYSACPRIPRIFTEYLPF
jgi:hypothetical protein